MTDKEIVKMLDHAIPKLPDKEYRWYDLQKINTRLSRNWNSSLTRAVTTLREALIDAGVPKDDAVRYSERYKQSQKIEELRDEIFKLKNGFEKLKRKKALIK